MRYMDDFVIISEDLEQLKRWEKQIEIFLADVLKLQLNPKTTIVYAKNGKELDDMKNDVDQKMDLIEYDLRSYRREREE